jgi:histidinol dehydrogenase
MPRRFTTADADFDGAFSAFLADKRENDADVSASVAAILTDVAKRGDAAVIAYTKTFDRLDLTPASMRIDEGEVTAAIAQVDPAVLQALDLAAARIEAFHARHTPEDTLYTDDSGVTLGARWRAIDAVGLYVPGGLASYPSSVLMNAIPAKVAGVRRMVMAVPTPEGRLNPLVLAAARRAGVDEIYRIGGAQAVAALAYGTATIPAVDMIVGPGNAYVAAAKRQVFGRVGIDMIAGPSEILVVADGVNKPHWIAADLLSQAEHDENAQSILITDDPHFADEVIAAVDRLLERFPREQAAKSWARYGAVIEVAHLDQAASLIDRIAPEHLELAIEEPYALAAKLRHAGAIFLGRLTPEAIGDYVAGPNHVLPTARSARFSSGLNVLHFMKRTTLVDVTAAGLAAIGPAAVALAEAEGLPAHALSVALRLDALAAEISGKG